MGERRVENRLLCADMTEVEWMDWQADLHREIALLEDISPLGACLQTEAALPEYAVVVLNLAGIKVRAMVQYCRQQDIGFFSGVTFAPGSRWSNANYRPKHLTDPLILPPREPGFIV
jgi:hypothetical protein